MNRLEWVAAIAVGIALLWMVAQPLLMTVPIPVAFDDLPDPEETPRGRALLALKELEFDRATGKLSDEDFAMLNARYSRLALEALDAAPTATAEDALEAMISARVATLAPAAAGSARCLAHGAVATAGARFCPDCGHGLVAGDADTCLACGTPAPADAAFCSGCGVRLRA